MKSRRILTVLLVALMLLTMIPSAAFAGSGPGPGSGSDRTLHYDANGGTGSTPSDEVHKNGEEFSLAPKPVDLLKDNHELVGWNTNADSALGTHYDFGASFAMTGHNAILYAEWELIEVEESLALVTGSVTVTSEFIQPHEKMLVSYGGGTETELRKGEASIVYDYEAGKKLKIEAVNDDSVKWQFKMWNTAHFTPNPTGNPTEYEPAVDSTHTPAVVWERAADSYEVVYEAPDATEGTVPIDGNLYSENDGVTVLGNIGAPPLKRTGFLFDGWKDQDGVTRAVGSTFNMPAKDVTLTAQWTPLTFTIQHVAASGSGSGGGVGGDHGSVEVEYGTQGSFVLAPSETHTFTYDPSAGDIDVDFVADPGYAYFRHKILSAGTPDPGHTTEDPTTVDPMDHFGSSAFKLIEVHPQWAQGPAQITFNLGDHGLYDTTLYPTLTDTRTESIAVGEDVNEPQLGVDFYDEMFWRFIDWDTAVVNPVTGSATYNAVYEERHQITFDLAAHANYIDSSSLPSDPRVTLAYMTKADLDFMMPSDFPVEGANPEDFVVDPGWVFTGWLPDDLLDLDPVTGPRTYTAQYEEAVPPATLTVKEDIAGAGASQYSVNGGTNSGLSTHQYVITESAPGVPLAIGDTVRIYMYAFPGFDYVNETDFYVDVTITQADQEYTLDYITVPNRTYTFAAGGTVSFPMYCANGHLLHQSLGYYGDALDGDIDITTASVEPGNVDPAGNVTIVVKTKVNDGDSNMSPADVTLRKLALAVYEGGGYGVGTFIGFVKMTDGTIVSTDPRGDDDYLFTQSIADGWVSRNVVYHYGSQTDPVNLFFEFWDTASMGPVYNDPDGALTVYGGSEFDIDVWNVTFEDGVGGTVDTTPVDYSSQFIFDNHKIINVPTTTADTGHTFSGWLKNGSGPLLTDVDVKDIAITADTSFVAQWTEDEYTLTYDDSDPGVALSAGTSATELVLYNGSPLAVPKESYSIYTAEPRLDITLGYKFLGWQKNGTGAMLTKAQVEAELITADTTFVARTEFIGDLTLTIEIMTNGVLSNDGGVVTSSEGTSIPYPKTTTITQVPNTGYKFVKYYFDGSDDTNSTTYITMTEDKTLTAYYVGNDYTVTYIDNEGDGGSMSPSTHVYGVDKNLTANAFTYTGHTFAGWATSDGGTVVYTNQQSVKNLTNVDGGNVDLFAVWSINTFTIDTTVIKGTINPIDPTVDYGADQTITYAKQGSGYFLKSVTVDGTPVSIVTYPTSYTFTNVTQDHTIVVEYEYRFKVKPNSSIVNGDVRVTYNGEVRIVAPGGTTTFVAVDGVDLVYFQGEPDTGYEFLKWNLVANQIYFANNGLRSRNIYDSTTFTPYPHFTKTEYTVTYDDSAAGVALTPGTSATEGVLYEEYPVAVPEETYYNNSLVPGLKLTLGYKFLGWSSDGGTTMLTKAQVEATQITEDTTYVAMMEYIGNLTLTINVVTNGNPSDDGGVVTSSRGLSIPYPQTTKITEVTNPGYQFVKYNIDGTDKAWTPIWINMTEDKTLTAYYVGNDYTVSYLPNGSTDPLMPDSDHIYGVDKALTENTYTRYGYTFEGWALTAGGAKVYDDKEVVKNLTTVDGGNVELFAVWEKVEYTVTYDDSAAGADLGPGTSATEGVLYLDSPIAVPLEHYYQSTPAPKLKLTLGYKFLGWQKNGTGALLTKAQVEAEVITENTTFVAVTEYIGRLTLTINTMTNSVASTDGGVVTSSLGTSILYPQTTKITEVTNPGYKFVKYNIDGTDKAWTPIWINMTEDKTLTAYYVGNDYTVSYLPNGSTDPLMPDSDHIYGVDKALTENTYTRYGYTFEGWALTAGGAKVYDDKEVVKNLTAVDGGNVELFAVWEKVEYTVTYDDSAAGVELGPGTSATEGVLYLDSPIAVPLEHYYQSTPAPKLKLTLGYKFLGWQKNGTGALLTKAQVEAEVITENTTFVAVTEYIGRLTLTINTMTNSVASTDGGVVTSSLGTSILYPQTTKITEVTNPGYKFVKYNIDGTDKAWTPIWINMTEDKTLTAYYVGNDYTVSYLPNGSTDPLMPDSDHIYGVDKALTENTYTRYGYTFEGWALTAGGAKVYDDKEVVKNLTAVDGGNVELFAVWEKVEYTVTYDDSAAGVELGPGTSATEGVLYLDSPIAVPLEHYYQSTPAPKLKLTLGYKFLGWQKNGTGALLTKAQVEAEVITENTTFVAVTEYIGRLTLTINTMTNSVASTDGGVVTSSLGTSILYPQTTKITEVTNPGYKFVKYNIDGTDKAWTPIWINMTEDKVLTAYYVGNPYTVTYDMNGGSGTQMLDSDHVYGVDKALSTNTYTRTGYTFEGWALTAGGAKAYDDSEIVKNLTTVDGGNVVLYAVWEPIVYNITYVMDGGTNNVGNPATYTIESAEIVLLDPTKDYYDFTGWTPTDTIPAGSIGDKTFTATWTPTVYTITYVMDGGTNDAGNPATYTVESSLITLADPTRANYDFTGWAPADNIPAGSNGDKVFTATWTPTVYTITYVMVGGTNNPANPATYTVESPLITLLAPARANYGFTGWTPAGTIPAGSTGDLVFTAGWAIDTFTVTFIDFDGTVLGTDVVGFGGDADAPADPEREGYEFTGWDTDYTNVTADLTVQAEYDPLLFTVTWENFDGTELEVDSDVPYGATPSYDGDEPARESSIESDFTFDGWTPAINPVTGDVTYTAQYTEGGRSYVVRWENFDGTLLEEDSVVYGAMPTYDGDTPERPDEDGTTFTFFEWSPVVEPITGDITYTAQFTENIPPEETPEAGPSWLWWLLLIPGIGLIILLLAFWLRVVPIVEKVTKNPDGTISIQWGYENRKGRKVEFEADDSVLNAQAGSIISSTLVNPADSDMTVPPVKFEKGRVENVFVTVASADAKVEWKIKSRKAKAELKKEEE